MIDDSPPFRQQVSGALEASGLSVVEAAEGYEALWRVRAEGVFDLILADIHMPNLDGFGVLEAMQVAGLTVFIPTLVLTARHAEGDVRRAIELGANDFLAKPFDGKMLQSRVRRMLDMDIR